MLRSLPPIASAANWAGSIFSLFGVGRGKPIGICTVLIVLNGLVWVFAIISLRAFPVLLGTALLAYTFGLRHAVDPDHIAAIDNVTRKLMQDGQRPAGAGFFFSLGHSTVVILASTAIAASASPFESELQHFKEIGGLPERLSRPSFCSRSHPPIF